MQIPTVAVKHPDDPSVRMIVNVDDAHQYEPWEEPKAAPAEGGDPADDAEDSGKDEPRATTRRGRRSR